MSTTSIPCLHAQIQGEDHLQDGRFETNTFSSLSCVQQSHCKENGVPEEKHRSSIGIIMLISFHIYMLSPYIIQIKLSCVINCKLCICFAFYHMYAYIQRELSLYNVRVKLCDPFHSIHKGSRNLTLPCATNVFLFGV